MLAKAAQSQAERQAEKESDEGAGMKNHPVMRTMYDHDGVGVIQTLVCCLCYPANYSTFFRWFGSS